MAKLAFLVFYALTALVTGAVSGLSRPATQALMTLLLMALLLAAAWARPRARLGAGFEPVLAAWLALAFLSSVFAPCPLRSLQQAVQLAAAAAFFYLLLGAGREFCVRAMAAVATAAAIFGLAVFLLGFTPRVAAPLGSHHYAAGFLLLHLPLTASLARSRRVWAVAAAVQALAILGTRSLAGIVVLLLLGLWALLRMPGRRWWLAGALALLAVPAALSPRTRSLLTRGEDPSLSLENRRRYLRTGAAMIAQHPLRGWGLGSVPLVAARYRPQTPDVMPQGETLPHLHNLPANLATEMGILGLALGAWMLWRLRSPALLAYAIFALADYQLDLPAVLFALAAVAAVSAPKARPGQPLSGAWRVALAMAALAAPFQSRCGWDDFERGRYAQAAQRLPDLIPVSAAAGAALLQAGQPQSAIPHLVRAAELDSYFTLAHYHLGRARELAGDRQGAVEAYSRALLVQPVTLFAEGWDPVVYRDAVRGALRQLQSLSAGLRFDERTRHRHAELRAFLAANAEAVPAGAHRRTFYEITDADLAHNTGLLVFRRVGAAKYTSGVTVLLPKPDFYIPPGIGYLGGLPEVRARP